MIAGIGVDMVKVERINRSLERYGGRIAGKILATQELADWRRSDTPAMLLAKRFAAKEAVAKALGTGMRGGVHFPQITITHHKSGAPEVTLAGQAEKRAADLGVTGIHISISDEDEYVVAFVAMERN